MPTLDTGGEVENDAHFHFECVHFERENGLRHQYQFWGLLLACLYWYTDRQEIFFQTKREFVYDSTGRREMERVPSDDPTSEARGDGVLEQLCHSLQLLASPA
jgi:hypothetical protein